MFSSIISSTTLAVLTILLTSAYFYVKYVFSYWVRRGVPFVKPSFPFGNFGKKIRLKLSIGEQVDDFYRGTTEPFVGVYEIFRPVLIVRDPKLVRNVLIKDFQHFVDRGVHNPLSTKNLREKSTPTLTSGKMRAIFTTLLDCKNPMQAFMDIVAKNNETVEIREIAARFATNAIASVAFGIEIDCFADPENPFRKYGRQVFEINWRNAFRVFCFNLSPRLLKMSGLYFVDKEVEDFMFDVVRQTLELREKNNIVRKDFFQLLVQLRNTGNVHLDDEWQTVITNDNSKTLSIEELTAQAFVFYVAGFETSSTTMSFCLYEIAKNPDIQRKIQEEIDTTLAEHGGKLTYESISELKYLECCINETLRKYPVAPVLRRECTKEYKVPESNVIIERGTTVLIPVFSLQRDPQYYAEPEKFDPLRFFSEDRNDKTIVDLPYSPFDDVARHRFGSKIGKMTTKVGIASVIQKFSVEICDEYHGEEQLTFLPDTSMLTSSEGINLKVKTRNTILLRVKSAD